MSEKRYDTRNDNIITENGPSDDYVVDHTTGKQVYYPNDICDLLNTQAETIEVLREWIRSSSVNEDYESLDMYDRMLIKYKERGQAALVPVERIELAKRRIAALEGE